MNICVMPCEFLYNDICFPYFDNDDGFIRVTSCPTLVRFDPSLDLLIQLEALFIQCCSKSCFSDVV